MPLTDLVAQNAILPALKVNGKKQALTEIAAKAAALTGQSERTILEILLQREKLGSTGVGNGVAIPHGKLPKLSKVFGLFARLDRAVDFEALDGQPVDLIFLLLAPEGAGADHLKALARVARLLRDSDVARKLQSIMESLRPTDVEIGSVVSLGFGINGERDIITYNQHVAPKVFIPNHVTAVAVESSSLEWKVGYEKVQDAMGIPAAQRPQLLWLVDPNDYLRPLVFDPRDARWRKEPARHDDD